MGSVTFGIPTELALRLQEQFKLKSFIETGTFLGDTTLFAAQHFDSVYTIEHDRERYLAAALRLNDQPNVHLYHGDSRDILHTILCHMPPAAMFWLDAHWCLEGVHQENCPLLDELELILGRPQRDVILIDDARFFLHAPPLPPQPGYWPSYSSILALIKGSGRNLSMTIVDDVILIVPANGTPADD